MVEVAADLRGAARGQTGALRYDRRMIFFRILMMVALAGMPMARGAWTEDFEVAKRAAREGGKPILALFTGSDWCPPCKEFDREVATSDAFLGYASKNVVLLKLDYPQHMLQAPRLIAQNAALAARIGGEEFPRFYLLDAKGEVLRKVDTRTRRAARTLVELYLIAIEESVTETNKVSGAR